MTKQTHFVTKKSSNDNEIIAYHEITKLDRNFT